MQGSARSRVTEPELETGAGAGYVETVAPPQGEVVGRTDIIVPVGDVLLIVVIIHVQGRAPPFDRTVGSVEVQPHRVLRADVDGRSVEGPCFGFVGIHGILPLGNPLHGVGGIAEEVREVEETFVADRAGVFQFDGIGE